MIDINGRPMQRSLPLRGAWIEMTMRLCCLPARLIQSLPLRGAWIEIKEEVNQILSDNGRSLCGERGLKYKINGR